ncbi:mitochondrial thiamine pyrophosphate transporter [Peltigera leucophlebia]|nr:mitochondrial thiamine pyrophosphate transporter [Peltigera leucophlebia]
MRSAQERIIIFTLSRSQNPPSGLKASSGGGRSSGWAGFKAYGATASHLLRRGAVQTFKTILHDEGVTAFWKGNIPAELLYITYGSIQFSIYRFSTQILSPLSLPTSAESFISGAVAGAVATTLTYPFDLLRTRFAAQGPDKVYVSLRSSILTIARDEGFVGFFQGLGAGVGQVVPYMGLLFSAYETLRPPLSHLSLPFGSGDAMAGIMAGVIAKTGVFPLDLIRKRLQVQGPTRMRYVGGMIPVYEKSV